MSGWRPWRWNSVFQEHCAAWDDLGWSDPMYRGEFPRLWKPTGPSDLVPVSESGFPEKPLDLKLWIFRYRKRGNFKFTSLVTSKSVRHYFFIRTLRSPLVWSICGHRHKPLINEQSLGMCWLVTLMEHYCHSYHIMSEITGIFLSEDDGGVA